MAAVLSCLGKPGRLRKSASPSANTARAMGIPWWLLVSDDVRKSSTVMLSQNYYFGSRRWILGLGIFLVGTGPGIPIRNFAGAQVKSGERIGPFVWAPGQRA